MKKEDLVRLCKERGLKGNRKMNQKRLMEILAGCDAREKTLLSPNQVDGSLGQDMVGTHPQLSLLLTSCKGVWVQQKVFLSLFISINIFFEDIQKKNCHIHLLLSQEGIPNIRRREGSAGMFHNH